MNEPTAYAPPYRHVAWAYDTLASAYSLGAIDRAKRHHHQMIKPGMRVLYAGAGRGKEITAACRLGAEVTCVEPCPAMSLKLHDRLAKHGERFTVLPRAMQDVCALPEYDLVVAHFFLNVFDASVMPGILEHLCRFVKPSGRLVIADFAPAKTNAGLIDRSLRDLYYRPVNLAGWLLRICAIHPIYDYESLLIEQGLTIESRHAFHVLPGLPKAYSAIIAKRP